MSIKEKLANAKENSWLIDLLSDDERAAAELIENIAVSIQLARRECDYTQKELADK
jgi:hypothetical protein